jgi:hypothetical protein
MPNINDLKNRLDASKSTKARKHIIDLSLGDTGDVLPDMDYDGRIISARLIIPNAELTEKVSKIDLCIEILGDAGQRIGALNDNLFVSPRCLRRLKEFLLSAGLETEANSKSLDARALCDILPGRLVTINTRESVLPGTYQTVIIVASYSVRENATGAA